MTEQQNIGGDKKIDDFKERLLDETELMHNPGSYDRGDYYWLYIEEFYYKKRNLERYHASGDMIGLVRQHRKRVYAKNSRHSPSETDFIYVVGENENGNVFAHPVPQRIGTLGEAIDWIWDGNEIIERQGDIAITPATHLKNPASAEKKDIKIVDAHRAKGEIYENGALYCRNAEIYHEKDQHPSIEVEDGWMRILVAKESQNDPGAKTVD